MRERLVEFFFHDMIPGLVGYQLHALNHGVGKRFWRIIKTVTRHSKKG